MTPYRETVEDTVCAEKLAVTGVLGGPGEDFVRSSHFTAQALAGGQVSVETRARE